MKNIRKRVGICNNILSQEISFKVICGRSLILISIRHQQICQMSEVYEYVRDIASLFQPMRYGLQDNPMGLYSDYESFKKHFVRYWKNALDISRADLDEVRNIFDDVLSTQESCKNRAVTSVFFENGKALTIEDCLEAIYEVLKIA